MKKFKKVLVLLIVLVLIGAMNVFAKNEKVILNPSKTEVKEGEIFDLKIDIACETQFNGLTGILQYDEAKLELCEDEDGNLLGYGYINYYNLESAEKAILNLNKKIFWILN